MFAMNDGVSADGTYTFFFAFRIPKKEHGLLLTVLGKMAKMKKKHGMLQRRLFRLEPTDMFPG
jgi:vacuolar-type H+-ATPase subunit I/STV1